MYKFANCVLECKRDMKQRWKCKTLDIHNTFHAKTWEIPFLWERLVHRDVVLYHNIILL